MTVVMPWSKLLVSIFFFRDRAFSLFSSVDAISCSVSIKLSQWIKYYFNLFVQKLPSSDLIWIAIDINKMWKKNYNIHVHHFCCCRKYCFYCAENASRSLKQTAFSICGTYRLCCRWEQVFFMWNEWEFNDTYLLALCFGRLLKMKSLLTCIFKL